MRCFGDGSSKKRDPLGGIGRIRSTLATEKGSVSGGPVGIEDVCARCTATLTGRQFGDCAGKYLEHGYLLSINFFGKIMCRL